MVIFKNRIFEIIVSSMKIYLKYLLFVLIFVCISACGNNDAEYTVVNFDKHSLKEKDQQQVAAPNVLKVAVGAMISPIDTLSSYESLLDYIGRKLNLKVELVQRKTYEEVNELIATNQVDIAFICTGPYVTGKIKYGFEALVTPVVRGEPFYQAYLIVNKNSPYETLEDLKGKTFAFTDPDSNTGYFAATYWLSLIGENPDSFFSKFDFTHSHDNSILSVAKSIVDGASVNSIVWEYFNARDPVYTSKTKIIKRSEPFGAPPLVASISLPQNLKSEITQLFCKMHEDPEGQQILNQLMIDSFLPTEESWYATVKQMELQIINAGTKAQNVEKH